MSSDFPKNSSTLFKSLELDSTTIVQGILDEIEEEATKEKTAESLFEETEIDKNKCDCEYDLDQITKLKQNIYDKNIDINKTLITFTETVYEVYVLQKSSKDILRNINCLVNLTLNERLKVKEHYLNSMRQVTTILTLKFVNLKSGIESMENNIDVTLNLIDSSMDEIKSNLKESITSMKISATEQLSKMSKKPRVCSSSPDYWKTLKFELDILKESMSLKDMQLWAQFDTIKLLLEKMGSVSKELKQLQESLNGMVKNNQIVSSNESNCL